MGYSMIYNIIEQITNASGSLEKESIIRNNSDNELLKRVFRMTYSKRLQYYIKKWPHFDSEDSFYTLEEGLDFLENKLAKREITGNAAISALVDIMKNMNAHDVEVLTKVLKRDLRCGASVSIANKVWKKLIPEQPQMLASSSSEKTLANIKYPAYAQLKADGARCFAEIRGDDLDDVVLLTRSGNEYFGLDKLKRQLIDMTKEVREHHSGGVMIDGELVYHETIDTEPDNSLFEMFDETKDYPELSKAKEFKQVNRTESNGLANKSIKDTISEAEAEGMYFQVWDYVPLDIVYEKTKLKSDTYDIRFKDLSDMVEGFDKLILIENHIVNNLQEARAIYKMYVEMGLEGIILKNINSYWENKRSKNLVKFKEVITVDLKCVGSYEHRKQPGKLGGLMFVSEDGRITVNAGSGLKDKPKEKHELDRTHLWNIKDSIIGTIWELNCNGWVTSEGRDDTVGLFLPIIVKRRNDKDVANTFEDAFGVNFTEATGIE